MYNFRGTDIERQIRISESFDARNIAAFLLKGEVCVPTALAKVAKSRNFDFGFESLVRHGVWLRSM